MNYYSHHIGDYSAHTAHLSLLEHGVYRRMIDLYYLNESAFPSDVSAVCRKVGAKSDDEKLAVDAVLAEFFMLTDEGYCQRRCDAEIGAYKAKIDQASRAGKASAERKSNGRSTESQRSFNDRSTTVQRPFNENSTDVQPTKNQEPITINQEPVKPKAATPSALPDWVPADAWQGFVEMRKAIKKPIAASAVPLAIGALEKLRDSGSDPRQVLEQSTLNSWQGLFEVRPNNRGSPASQLGTAGQATANAAQRLIEKFKAENEQAN